MRYAKVDLITGLWTCPYCWYQNTANDWEVGVAICSDCGNKARLMRRGEQNDTENCAT